MNYKIRMYACFELSFNIMYRCWETDPALRPSFTDILDLFSGIRKFYESLEYVPKTNM